MRTEEIMKKYFLTTLLIASLVMPFSANAAIFQVFNGTRLSFFQGFRLATFYPIPASSAAAWQVIAMTEVSGGGTSPAIDTTGANLIVFFNEGTGFVTVTDNKSNSYTELNDPSGTPRADFRYSINPTVGTGHTWTISSTASMVIVAFKKTAGSPVFDAQSIGASGSSGGWPNGTTVNAGSVTPSTSADLMLTSIIFNTAATFTGATVNSGYSIIDSVHSSTPANLRYAIKIKTDAAAENPGWTNGTGAGADYAMVHAAFK